MLIGELARQAGISAKTIRYYEEIRILDDPGRTASGYRNYESAALDRLEFVRASQAIGLGLGEIREILALRDGGETPCAHVAALIQAKTADIEDRITELGRMRAELKRISRRAARLRPKDCGPRDICHIIER